MPKESRNRVIIEDRESKWKKKNNNHDICMYYVYKIKLYFSINK